MKRVTYASKHVIHAESIWLRHDEYPEALHKIGMEGSACDKTSEDMKQIRMEASKQNEFDFDLISCAGLISDTVNISAK